MNVGRRFAGREDMASIARAAFGPDRRLARVDRLRGSSKKGVYRLAFDDASSAVSYVWDESENYWPPSPGEAPRAVLPLSRERCGCWMATSPTASR